MKDTFYFQHDYEPTADPKIQALLHKFGGLGYGLWWRIIEMLHSDEQHKIEHKKYIYLAIAGQMSTSVEIIQDFLFFCINDVELLKSDGDFFWSERVNRNINKRNDISLKRSFAGKKSAEQRSISSTNAEQVSTSVQQNPTNKRKGKEIKEKESNTIPTFLEFFDYVKSLDETHTRIEQPIKQKYDSWVANDWHDGNGNKITNWKLKIVNTLPYIKKDNPISKFKVNFPR